jgi:methyl-accepting chemotaxis protein
MGEFYFMKRRNQLMLGISLFVVVLSLIIHGLHRFTAFADGYQIIRGNVSAASPIMLTWIALLPVFCLLAAAVLYRMHPRSKHVPLL